MKYYAVFYYEGRREVCWTCRAASEEDALRDFNYEVAMGRIDHVNDKKRVTVSECY